MNIRTLELLQTIGFLDKNCQATDVSRFQPRHLQEILEYYAKERLKTAEEDSRQFKTGANDLSALISSVSASRKPRSLLPTSLVFSRIYVDDPLFPLSVPPDKAANAYRASMRMPPESGVSAADVAEAIDYFSSLSPLIKDGVVAVLPLHALHARRGELPIHYSEDGFRSQVPEHLHDFVHQSAIVREVIADHETGALLMPDRPVEKPTRMIAVGFTDDSRAVQEIFSLNPMRDIEVGENRRISFRLGHEEAPPSEESYQFWVYQSINQAIIGRLIAVAKEMATASDLGGVYLTESAFEANLFGMSTTRSTRASDRVTAVNFLTANAPSLNVDSAETVSRVRSDNPRLFERFQQSLLSVAGQLNGIDENFDERACQLFEAEIRPQLNELSTALAKVAAGIGSGVVLGATSILMALLSSRSLPLGAVIGLGGAMTIGRALPSVAEYISKKPGPAYIWKKLNKGVQ